MKILRLLLKFTLFPIAAYLLGLAWFVTWLPQPAGPERTDGIVVVTGGRGRVARGFELIEQGLADRLLISGVAPEVRPQELAAQFGVDMALMTSKVDLGRAAIDTRTNGLEVANWVQSHNMQSIRLVTNDWHMRRARKEIAWRLGSGVRIVTDAVPSEPGYWLLFREYNKYLVSPFGDQLGLE